MELCDIYNIKREKIGIKDRALERTNEEFMLAVHVWIIDDIGRVLIQRRADCKKYDPYKWGTTGGFAKAGETSINACIRETLEEKGIKLDTNRMLKVITYFNSNIHFDVWLYRIPNSNIDISCQQSEVSTVEWVTIDQLENMHFEKG